MEQETREGVPRERTLTDKGQEFFEENRMKRITKINRLWEDIDHILHHTFWDKLQSITIIETKEQELSDKFRVYSKLVSDCEEFIIRNNDESAMKEYEVFVETNKQRNMAVEKTFEKIHEIKQELQERGSRSSGRSSAKSNRSNTSSALAKVEAARVKIKYSDKERDIMKQKINLEEEEALMRIETARRKAEIDSNLNRLKYERELAAAEAEVKAMEMARGEPEQGGLLDGLLEEQESPAGRTEQYVKSHANLNEHADLNPAARPFHPHSAQDRNWSPELFRPLPPSRMDTHLEEVREPPFVMNTYPSQNHMSSEFTRFLLKKDLLFARLSVFSEEPESYLSWKGTFRRVMEELSVDASEEIELLIKWLGPVSSSHAKSIKISSVNNPSLGLKRLWERLDDRYGCPEMVEEAIKRKLEHFPKLSNKDNKKLYDLTDILAEIQSIKDNHQYHNLLAYYDTSSGILPIIRKLPYALQEKWTSRAVRYKRENRVTFPPFDELVAFMQEMSRIKNDPSFIYDVNNNVEKPSSTNPSTHNRLKVNVRKTEATKGNTDSVFKCILHTNSKHTLNECKAFRAKSIEERRQLVKENGLCFRCCGSKEHFKRDCKVVIKCTECGSDTHPSALHITPQLTRTHNMTEVHGGEHKAEVDSKCTQICGNARFTSKSCSKTILVKVFREGFPDNAVKLYAIIDDQSNRSLVKSKVLNDLQVKSEYIDYILTSCAGSSPTKGRSATGLIIQSLDGSTQFKLPTVIECNHIPHNRSEIPTPCVARSYPHLRDIAGSIPDLDDQCDTLLLIGRDLLEAHHVLDQRLGPKTTPYAQRLHLGWVIVGEACHNQTHIPEVVNVNKINILGSGRPSLFLPCNSAFNVEEITEGTATRAERPLFPSNKPTIGQPNTIQNPIDPGIFTRSAHDEKIGFSEEDRNFVALMDKDFKRDCDGSWKAPLPFKKHRQKLPNNRPQALKRANILATSLRKNDTKRQHFISFMEKIFSRGHAGPAQPLKENQECWYLPLFGVYHPRKPDQIRGVFDSSATYEGTSLNNVLLQGPDLTNSLLGVLLRFRKEMIAVVADIQHMFHCFKVVEEHRNYLRFFWHRDNDVNNELMEYCMFVHVFGNRPSPAVATYGLRKIADISENTHGIEVAQFIRRNFYVDDGLTSCPTAEEAISLLQKTQDALKRNGNLRLHKFASNSSTVMKTLDPDDLADGVYYLDLEDDPAMQRSLGINWNLTSDSFIFSVSTEDKPLTRRGVLSTVNSLYDPLGFLAPVIIVGRLIMRQVVSETSDWDEPLTEPVKSQWATWKSSLQALERSHVPRAITQNLSKSTKRELLTFSDASEKAIAAVSYLRTTYEGGSQQVGFILGKTKVAPSSGHTIPRLELCAAVLAIEVAQTVQDHIDIEFQDVKYFSDSRVVLGYIHNDTRRFHVYVSNRVEKIRNLSLPEQWSYVPTNMNPADEGSRGILAENLQRSVWLNGPSDFLNKTPDTTSEMFELIEPREDKEIRNTCLKTQYTPTLGTHRFERFQEWNHLTEAIALLKRFLEHRKENKTKIIPKSIDSYKAAEKVIIKAVQQEIYAEETDCLRSSRSLPRNSPILSLDPFLDDEGILRVGGRLKNARVDTVCTHPILIPGKHHTAKLLIIKCHQSVRHQGRYFTEGKVRSSGYWITGCRRLVVSILNNCVVCRRLRRQCETQKMSDLPEERLIPGQPPFTSVGVDVFGPWNVITRRTRGSSASSKRWAVLFTCLVTRAVHIEVLEEMSSSSFINALRRFMAIRGKVKTFWSDRGTNFVGAVDPLHIDAIWVEDFPLKQFLYNEGTIWKFNPPHASHMGGVWERLIGITRRILDSMLLDHRRVGLTHEVLVTLLAETSAMINSRPLTGISSDPNSSFILTPNILLTQKMDVLNEKICETDSKDLMRVQWKRVQHLAKVFWDKWKKEYLHTLQTRKKWHQTQRNVRVGDVILMREKDTHRNEWPLGIVTKVFPGQDDLVRKVEVKVNRNDKITSYTRPVNDIVILLEQ